MIATLLVLVIAGAGTIVYFVRRPAAWTDDWTAPPGYAEMLSDLSAGRADDGERRLEKIFHRHRSPVWHGRASLSLGLARLRRHEFIAAAAALADSRLLAGPAGPFAAIKRAEALTGAGKAREAAELLDKARPGTVDPVLADDAALGRARADAARGFSARARQSLVAYLGSPACRDQARVLDAAAKIAEQGGDRPAAADLYRRLYLEQPRSKEAATALEALTAVSPGRRFRPEDLPALARRAQLQIKAGDGKGALATWDLAFSTIPSASTDLRWRLDVAEAAIEARQLDRALRLLGRLPVRKGETRRGWLLGRTLAGMDHNRDGIACLRAAASGSDQYAEASQYLLATVLDQTDHDREALEQFMVYISKARDGERLAAATWRAAWLSYRLTKKDQAARLFERLLEMKEATAYHPSATYWLGRAREASGQRSLAIDSYARLASQFSRDYYGLLAAARLSALGAPGANNAAGAPTGPGDNARSAAPRAGETDITDDGALGQPSRAFCESQGNARAVPRLRSGCELEICGLFQDAEREYDAAASSAGTLSNSGTASSVSTSGNAHSAKPARGASNAGASNRSNGASIAPGSNAGSAATGGEASQGDDAERNFARPLLLRLSEIAMRRGDRPAAIVRLKAAVPDYLGVPIGSLPKSYWEILYPRPDWNEISAAARAAGLDPAFVCGLILQESAFNPLAVSQAGAIGLMQVRPETGADAARALGVSGFTGTRLIEPAMNVRLGTWHLAGLIARFDRSPELALAAYNAGEARVHQWQTVFGISDPSAFIEEIPFTETRLYVKRILSHAAMYKAIYGP